MQSSDFSEQRLKKFLIEKAWSIKLKQGFQNFQEIHYIKIWSINLQQIEILKQFKMLKQLKIAQTCQEQVLDALGELNLDSIQVRIKHKLKASTLSKFRTVTNLHFLSNGSSLSQESNIDQIANNFSSLQSIGELKQINIETLNKFKKLQKLKEIRFSNVKITLEGVTSLCSYLPHLTHLSFTYCQLRDAHIKTISEHILHLSSFNISRNFVSNRGVEYLSVYEQCLQALNIVGNLKITSKGVVQILKLFRNLQDLRIIDQQMPVQIPIFEPKLSLHTLHLCTDDLPEQKSLNKFLVFLPKLINLTEQCYFCDQTALVLSKYNRNLQSLKLADSIFRFQLKPKLSNVGLFYASKLRKLKTIFFKYVINEETQRKQGQPGIFKMLRNLRLTFCDLDLVKQVVNIRFAKTMANLKLLANMRNVILK